MAENRRRNAPLDLVAQNRVLLQEYVHQGQAYCGTHPRARLQSFRAKLRNLKDYLYTHAIDGPDPEAICAKLWLTCEDTQLDYEPAGVNEVGEKQVRVYWRSDRIAAARAREGLAINPVPDDVRVEKEKAREWLLANL